MKPAAPDTTTRKFGPPRLHRMRAGTCGLVSAEDRISDRARKNRGSQIRASTEIVPEGVPRDLLSKRRIGPAQWTRDWLPDSDAAASLGGRLAFRSTELASNIVSVQRYESEGADGVGCGNPSPTTRTRAKRSSSMATFREGSARPLGESRWTLVLEPADGHWKSRSQCLGGDGMERTRLDRSHCEGASRVTKPDSSSFSDFNIFTSC